MFQFQDRHEGNHSISQLIALPQVITYNVGKIICNIEISKYIKT